MNISAAIQTVSWQWWWWWWWWCFSDYIPYKNVPC